MLQMLFLEKKKLGFNYWLIGLMFLLIYLKLEFYTES